MIILLKFTAYNKKYSVLRHVQNVAHRAVKWNPYIFQLLGNLQQFLIIFILNNCVVKNFSIITYAVFVAVPKKSPSIYSVELFIKPDAVTAKVYMN